MFLAGVALLAVHDGVEWLRLAVGCLQVGGGLIAGGDRDDRGPASRGGGEGAGVLPGRPYGGPPLIAFMADRPVPGGQPDQFITTHARALSAVRTRIAAVTRVCG
ncbi:MAG: hypothetical protein M3Z06_05350 [Actinomycetota bacterium]|nr:hypothetical protein [Actinomycetota bacterium]